MSRVVTRNVNQEGPTEENDGPEVTTLGRRTSLSPLASTPFVRRRLQTPENGSTPRRGYLTLHVPPSSLFQIPGNWEGSV